jgi:hypothetical protein
MACCRLSSTGQTRRYGSKAAHGVDMAPLLKSRVEIPDLPAHQATGREPVGSAPEGRGARAGRVEAPKNREMKVEPTMLLITKERFLETPDVYKNKHLSLIMPRYL